MAEDVVDVLIIGAGAAGAAVAWSLVDTKMKILCLEQGPWMDPASYPSTRRDWEAAQLKTFSNNPNTRAAAADYPINVEDSAIDVLNFNGVGGGTILYSAHFPRMHPSDFRVKSLDGVAEDWPIDYQQLEPYFAENDRMMGVSGLAGDPACPPKQPPLPPLPLGKMGDVMGAGFNKLGWHWWPSDGAIASRDYQGREGCGNLGPCHTGCAKGAKASVDITYWPEALRRGVELRTGCRVREITLGEDGLASGVIYYDELGVECRQRAEMVIVACNGVGTPRLLLNSASPRFPTGLANSSDMVGRNLMFHPWGATSGVFEQDIDSHLGPGGVCLLSQEFYESDSARDFMRGYTLQVTRGAGPMITAINGMNAGLIPWGRDHHQAFARRFAHTVHLGVICEDLPELHNRVTLDHSLLDSNGIACPKINYRLSDNSINMLKHGNARSREVLAAAGASDINSLEHFRGAGWHLMGTARMGLDPQTSVVNEWGRCHDVKNVFIVDGSILVTSGAVNPTSTIQALALYIADQIKENLATLFD